MRNIKNYCHQSLSEIWQLVEGSERGLSEVEASARLERDGHNTLPHKSKSRLKILLAQFVNPLVIILLFAVAVSLAVPWWQHGELTGHDWIDPLAILAIVLLNAGFGWWQEVKAENTMEALQQLQPTTATVRRHGKIEQIDAATLVAGDVVVLAEGDKVPADTRLLEAVALQINESSLTGESMPVSKDAEFIGSGDTPLAERHNMLFSGTALSAGRATGVVVATGKHTQMGNIAEMLATIVAPPTPLERRLARISSVIGVIVFVVCVVIFALGVWQQQNIFATFLIAVALAVGAVPEGLPAVMTISLAVGVAVMARKNVLVRELKAVETLGNVTMICSDKTGTITQNKMQVTALIGADLQPVTLNDAPAAMLRIAVNCNDAQLPAIGDPTEIALLQIAADHDSKPLPRTTEVPFSSANKWMSTTHTINGVATELIKGAPEVVAQFCEPSRQAGIVAAAEQLAGKGLRTIAVAEREVGNKIAHFCGIFGLQDPPRPTVKAAIATAHTAGIGVTMITGDHAITARAIGKQVGIDSTVIEGAAIEQLSDTELRETVKTCSIFARVAPQHKVRLCAALQANGEVVAMTGDGVNDAPALKIADVGIAMGRVGTAIAREASSLILLDDSFKSVVAGVAEGRRIFINIKKSVAFLLRTNAAEVILLLTVMLAGLPLPLLPIHLLFLNLLTDSFPALALAAEPAEKNLMQRPPRSRNEGFLHGEAVPIALLGGAAAMITLAVFLVGLRDALPLLQNQTLAMTTLVAMELVVIFSIRSNLPLLASLRGNAINPWVVKAVALGAALYAAALLTPLNTVLKMELFPAEYWVYPLVAAVVIVVIAEGMKWWEECAK